MSKFLTFISLLTGFVFVTVAAVQITRIFRFIKLPIITGFILTGIAAGPFVLKLIPEESVSRLFFINEVSLAFIAFAASSELYLKELRARFNSIKWNTLSQLLVTFVVSSVILYLISDWVPFMSDLNGTARFAAAILMATIFVARSPASSIAVIAEMRAKGPFTQTALGVTVLKDFLIIVLFSINISISIALVDHMQLTLAFVIMILLELAASLALGLLLFLILKVILSLRIHKIAKTVYILSSGYLMYELHHLVKEISAESFGKPFLVEPLLICIIGSFVITNYSRYRYEFIKIINDVSPVIYASFFTMIGASMALDVLPLVWLTAILFFVIRLGTLVFGSYVGMNHGR